MGVFKFLKNALSKKESSEVSPAESPKEVPEGLCPNCWGHQEYEGEFFEAVRNEKIDTNNLTERKGWVQAYAANHFEGIKLKKNHDVLECETCRVKYLKEGTELIEITEKKK